MYSGERVVRSMDGEWHKALALVMTKLGAREVVITPTDLLGLEQEIAIVVQELPDGMHIRLVDGATAKSLQNPSKKPLTPGGTGS